MDWLVVVPTPQPGFVGWHPLAGEEPQSRSFDGLRLGGHHWRLSGIGRALAIRLASTGARLVLADVHAEKLAELATELNATAVPTDVADHEAVEALAAAARDAQLVCLNAGIVGSALGAPWEVDPQEWQAVVAVNLGGVINGLRAFVPRLLAWGRPGHILITASLAGLATFAGGVPMVRRSMLLWRSPSRRRSAWPIPGPGDGPLSGSGPHRDVPGGRGPRRRR